MKSQDLREQRAKLVANARVVIDQAEAEKRDLSSEEQMNVDAMFSQVDILSTEVLTSERKEKLEKAEAEMRDSAGRKAVTGSRVSTRDVTDEDRKASIRAWALSGNNEFSADDEIRATQCGISLRSNHLNLRAMSKGTASLGGHTVPVNMASEVEKELKHYSDLRKICKVLPTNSGVDIDYPRVSDVSNVATIVGEAGSIPTNVDASFSKITLKSWKWISPTVLISTELIQDSEVDLEKLLAELLAERIARGQEVAFVTGNGTTSCQGLNAATVANNLATGNPMTFDKIIDLIHSVDRSYRANANFLCHDTTLAAMRKVKDSNNQYIWQPSLIVGEPDRLYGYNVNISNEMVSFASPGDNASLVLFGDFQRYVIRDVSPSMVISKFNELYAATGQVGFLLSMRTDGRYVGHDGCVKSLNSFDAP